MHVSVQLNPQEVYKFHSIIDGIVTMESQRRFLMTMNEQEIGTSGHQTTPADCPPADVPPPLPLDLALCVDLDGTLVKSDTLVDSILVLARQHPLSLLSLPGWLLQGKAAFKRHICQAVTLD